VNRSQRMLLAAASALSACFLHVMLCRWGFQTPVFAADDATRLLTWSQRAATTSSSSTVPLHTGLFTRNVSRESAILFGIVVPFWLLLFDVHLLLGWRYRRRLERHQCTKCGYDLHAAPTADHTHRPACGWPREARPGNVSV